MIQYPKNTHLTLASVEAGLGSMNILRDPPKSLVVPYRPRVGQTSQIADEIGGSGDRVCEGVLKYARGLNPFGPSGNFTTNGGQVRYRSGSSEQNQGGVFGNRQSFLPYRVVREGAFRPPVLPPQDLLPLSRLPRSATAANSNPGSSERVTFNNTMKCSKDMREIRQQLLQVCSTPKAIFNIENPSSEPVAIVKSSTTDKVRTAAQTNLSSKKYVLGINTDPERGIKTQKNTLYGSIPCSVFKNIQATPLQDERGLQPITVKERLKGNCSTNLSGQNEGGYIHSNIRLDRNTPLTSMGTNAYQAGVDINFGSRDYHLAPRSKRGGFENQGMKMSNYRDEPAVILNPKTAYQKAAMTMQQRTDNNYNPYQPWIPPSKIN